MFGKCSNVSFVQVANVWYSVNGERLGTYTGHTGAVWCVDCDCILFKINKYQYTAATVILKVISFKSFKCFSKSRVLPW